jgi:hypothetical protein
MTIFESIRAISKKVAEVGYLFSASDMAMISYALGQAGVKTLLSSEGKVTDEARDALVAYDKNPLPGTVDTVFETLVDLGFTEWPEGYQTKK